MGISIIEGDGVAAPYCNTSGLPLPVPVFYDIDEENEVDERPLGVTMSAQQAVQAWLDWWWVNKETDPRGASRGDLEASVRDWMHNLADKHERSEELMAKQQLHVHTAHHDLETLATMTGMESLRHLVRWMHIGVLESENACKMAVADLKRQGHRVEEIHDTTQYARPYYQITVITSKRITEPTQ